MSHPDAHTPHGLTVYAAAWLGGNALNWLTSAVGLQILSLVLAFALRQLEARLKERRDDRAFDRMVRLAELRRDPTLDQGKVAELESRP